MTRTNTAKKVSIKSALAPMRAVEMRYLRAPPASAAKVPEGKVVVHNHVVGFAGGFRMWTQFPEDKLEVCSCGWAPQLGTHYRMKRS